ncbi:two-component sensor histidine kinase [Thiosulfatimonas sediminis]|uniref:histidine kinase n=1 Tax=Thiosulfatimonas sediminis TaxID=2675054 RepID=A0A6F8PU90_9GAMM|nr:ATP-binding protein [Thiosulfatimonas sediminis]BBP45584.1 two-component sensor histidine kinase [Thiosulfatimonas sediminis]
MGIRLKFVLFLVTFGFVILGTLVWSNQLVLHKTMLHYVDQRDQQRLERLKNNIEIYLQYEPISDVRALPLNAWQRLTFYSHRMDFQQMTTMVPRLIERFNSRRSLPPADEFESRVSLLTPEGDLLYGPAMVASNASLPIMQNGQLLAKISYHPLNELQEQADIEFAASQFKMFTLGAVLITFLALILLWPFGNHFLRPVRELNKAMHRLASGDLSCRLGVKRQDELGALQRNFNHLAATLEAAQGSRNQWVADISHELRTPLTVIHGSIEAMCDDIRPLNKQSLALVQTEVVVLQRLIEDLYQLSLSDVGALQYSMATVNLAEITQQTVEAMYGQAQLKGLLLETDIVPQAWIYGDASRLTQLVANLLSNALNYTDAQSNNGRAGRVQVSLQEQAHNYCLRIVDSSPGVSVDDIKRLTERFFRTEPSRNRRTGGAGLGLAMVSQIAKAHDAKLQIRQAELGGLDVQIVFARELQE